MARSVLVTGATGKLGTAVCHALLEAGFDVRATDLRYAREFPMHVELGDLRDEHFVYRIVEGVNAVVHLGNYPNAFAGPSAQRLLAENVAMNANVFLAARDVGVRTILFASSIQAMIRRDGQVPRATMAYLPLDGDLPANPGSNTYAQSKEFGERMLKLLSDADPELSATALRFPMLVTDGILRHFSTGRRPYAELDFGEATAHLFLKDAGRLVAEVLRKCRPGYHQYFPAIAMDLSGITAEEVLRERLGHVSLRKPIADFASLIDISALIAELGWTPSERLQVQVER